MLRLPMDLHRKVKDSPFYDLDETPSSSFHWQVILTAGLGFFTDAYDLFVIGIVTTWPSRVWHLHAWQTALLNSTSLLSAAIGAVLFGFLMDRLGRKTMYGVESILLILGALFSSLAPNFTLLIVMRFILGLGIGGDYPGSAILITEFANRSNRGKFVTYVFMMQGLGLIAGPLLSILIIQSGIPTWLIWRIILGIGAIPALFVVRLRRKMLESPRFLLHVKGDAKQTASVLSKLTTKAPDLISEESTFSGLKKKGITFLHAPFGRRLLATSLSWFLIDVAFYGNGISSHEILMHFFSHVTMVQSLFLSLLLFIVFALPGYFLAAYKMDSLGRRFIQWLGFLVMAMGYAIIAIFPGIVHDTYLFLLLYGITYFFIEFGPNTTTFIFPSELFPTKLRGVGHGIAAAIGKVGAFLAAFLFPILIVQNGMHFFFGLLATVSCLGVLITIFLLPESKKRSLEELNGMLASENVHHTYSRIMKSIHEEQIDVVMVEEMMAISSSDLVIMHRFDPLTGLLIPTASKGEDVDQFVLSLRFAKNEETSRSLATLKEDYFFVIDRKEWIVHNRMPRDNYAFATRVGLGSFVAFPLIDNQESVGILSFFYRDENQLIPEVVEKLSGFIQVVTLALIRTRSYIDVRQLAYTDALTQLPNRMGFETKLEERMIRYQEDHQCCFAFVILDLDHFKYVNDTYGHQHGDYALEALAAHLVNVLEPRDLAARLGGDEFILLLDEVEDEQATRVRLEGIIRQLPLSDFELGVSAGACLFPLEGRTYQELYRMADLRLYKAKNAGRGQIIVTDHEMANQLV